MKKIYLVFPDEKRDITNIYGSHIDDSSGVRVSYRHSVINGKIVPDAHQTLHIHGKILFEEE